MLGQCTEFKWRFAGWRMMARLLWFLDPPSPLQLKKGCQVGPPPTKLSGPAHVVCYMKHLHYQPI